MLTILLNRPVAVSVAVKQVWRTDGVQGDAYDKFVVEREEVRAAGRIVERSSPPVWAPVRPSTSRSNRWQPR